MNPHSAESAPAVVVVGIHGHGASHVEAARALVATGAISLGGLVDRVFTDADRAAGDAPLFTSLDDCLAAVQADVVILSTPIHTHLELAVMALEHGADLLLEKPPVTSNDELDQLLAVAERTGGLVQVGFQSLGSRAIPEIESRVGSGEIGAVTAIEATGTWVRTVGYWTRAAWSGRRLLDGVPVVDGVVTNPLAHAVQTMLRLGGTTDRAALASIELDQYRANTIEADDTSVVRVTPRSGPIMTAALTLCAEETTDPVVTVRGERGSIRFLYTRDLVEVVVDGETVSRSATGRIGLLDDLLRARRDLRAGHAARLVSSLADASAFTAILDAVRSAPAPSVIAEHFVDWRGSGDDRRPVIPGIEAFVAAAASTASTFAELGTPWSRR
ncbi:MAG TPA: Gfo/Idh/MocA family oxidoreductase [Plantibacter sp.]|uniref:Gfo/Idh/MocA family protein n=1 Tax=Plantibacter sp. TaxID=1871045 RepID=UPI002B919575|nr:Gfo/Idh/MocA family oxidoreductase [Plantibacter sp.]